ncbi:MAG: hypothetical protein KAJ75_06775 [Alphaproteobacteria bacterium]|nr:hypothetical protein [Alphaproteobacteria bacterium]
MIKKTFFILIAGLFLVTGFKKTEVVPAPHKVVSLDKSAVYYFHGNRRCFTCSVMEKYSRSVYEEHFKDKVDFKMVNIDQRENKHFISDYNMPFRTVVLVKVKDGKENGYKVLHETWQYIRKEQAFKNYLKKQIEGFLLSENKENEK